MTTKELFEQAVADSKELPSRPDNNTLLKLYSFYKQATDGDAPDEGPANVFDFVAKAKHDAWSKLKGTSEEEAMNQYTRLVEDIKSK